MKKLLLVLLVLALVVSSSFSAFAATEIKVGVAWPSLGSQAWQAMADYLRWYVDEYNEAHPETVVTLVETTAGDDAAAQETQIRDLINQGVNVVMSGAIDTTAIWSSITDCHNAGIGFISFCRRLTPGAPDPADAIVGPDTFMTAYVSVTTAVQKMLDNGIAAEDIKMIEIIGDLKDQNAMQYKAGCEAALAEYSCPLPVYIIESNWSAETVMNRLAPALQSNPDANLIFSPNEDMLIAVQSVLEAQDMWYPIGDENHFTLCAGGGCEIGLNMINDGYLDVTGLEDLPAVSRSALDYAVRIAQGESTGDCFINAVAVTPENYEQLLSEDAFWVYNYAKAIS